MPAHSSSLSIRTAFLMFAAVVPVLILFSAVVVGLAEGRQAAFDSVVHELPIVFAVFLGPSAYLMPFVVAGPERSQRRVVKRSGLAAYYALLGIAFIAIGMNGPRNIVFSAFGIWGVVALLGPLPAAAAYPSYRNGPDYRAD